MQPTPRVRVSSTDARRPLPVSPVVTASSSSPRGPQALYLTPRPITQTRTQTQPRSDPRQYRRHRQNETHRRNVVAWVPDSLAERCYSCQASFSLMLRRHHCRRCGNVFCDACSSSRMPLVNSGFFAPVRVCQKCSVAAKKAHAKMVQDRQKARSYQPRRHSDTAERERDTARGFFLSDGVNDGKWASKSHVAQSKTRNGRSDSATDLGYYRPSTFGTSSMLVGENSSPGSDMMEGGIMTSNGRRYAPLSTSPVFTRRVSSESYGERERAGSEDTDYAGGHSSNDGFLQTLPGEAVLVRNDNVRVRFMNRLEHIGRLYVTNYRLVFSPAPEGVLDGEIVMGRFSLGANVRSNVREDELPYASDLHTEALVAYQAIPLVSIERVKRKEMVETDSGLLEVSCKDFRRLQFLFEGLVSKQTFSLFDRTFALVRMHALGEPEGKVDEFAKFSLERFDGVHGAVDGWAIYDAVAEFQRMGISSSTNRWRLSYINDQYELCPTYPSVLAVPASVSDSVLAVASKFRSKGRIPVLSWRDRHTGAVICRSSQPLVGLGQKQCDKDVFLIQAIAATNPSSTKLVIIDARPWKNAVAQKTVGRAGYELTEHYETRHATASLKYADMVASEHNAAAAAAISAGATATTFAGSTAMTSINGDTAEPSAWDDRDRGRQLLETIESSLVLTECKLIFMGIENIHTMRKSYHKLMDLCTTKQSNDKWLDQLASTHWMDHISRILDSAVEIVRVVKEQKSSVLIHCSDGWDRTAQLTALAELLIDPYYRTITGFEVLIEKEWCSYGHKFRDRTGHGASNNSNETSPVFLQWIDCVFQVMAQCPSAFEFNERFLMLILDHLYSCRFGTFLYDSQRERVQQEALHPTQSLWSFLRTVDHSVVQNPFYQPQNAPRMKWKASVTATRQCFERTVREEYKEPHASIPHMTHNDCDVHSLTDEYADYGRARRTFGSSDGSSACSSPTSMTFGSTVAAASSPAHSKNDATGAEVNEALNLTHNQLAYDLQRRRIDSNESMLGDEDFDSWDGNSESGAMLAQPSCFHKLVRDLDAGFSFPQPLEASALSSFPSSPALAPRSRSFFFGRNAEDGGNSVRPSTPKSRSSLTSLFMPAAVDRPPLSSEGLWNSSDTDAISEGDEMGRYGALASCEDVIVPSCSMKSLKFWAHYYLRWDPTSHFDRDASVETETLYLDLLMRLEALTEHVETIHGEEAEKWERKVQYRLNDPRDFTTGRSPSRSLLPSGKPPRRSRISDGSTSSQDSVLSAATDLTVEMQIAELEKQKRRNLEEVEATFQEQLARLLQSNSPSDHKV